MAYSSTPVVTWNRSTPRDGLLLNQEFAQIYSDIEDYISGNGGNAPTLTLEQVATGNATIAGTKTFSGAVILPQTTSPAQTAEGSIVWDTDNDLLTVGDGSSRKTMVDTSQDQTIGGTKTFSSKITGDISGNCDGHAHAVTEANGAVMRWKIMALPTWNMDSVAYVSFAHGLTGTKIRFVKAAIDFDDSLGVHDDCIDLLSAGRVDWTDVYIILYRTAGGIFDSTDFDSTAASRGYVTIGYID